MEKMVIMMINPQFWNKKRVLITGHTGFKGSWLCLILSHLKSEVFGYALDPPTDPSLFAEARINELVTSKIADIRDSDKLLKYMLEIQPEIVIHMAAQPLVLESYQFPVETYSVNVMGTVNLLEVVRNTPSVKAVLNVTTDKCYENREWIWGYREDEMLGGYDPYSSSKACSEIITSAYRRSFFNGKNKPAIATARAGNVIGGGDWAKNRLIPDFTRAVLNNEKIIIRNPNSIRPWQHVLGPLTGYLTLLEKLYSYGDEFVGAWNFGPDLSDARSVEWIIMKLCKIWGKGAMYEVISSPQNHEATYLKLDCSKSNTRLNWRSKWNLDRSLESIIDFNKAYLDNKDLKVVCQGQIIHYLNLLDEEC